MLHEFKFQVKFKIDLRIEGLLEYQVQDTSIGRDLAREMLGNFGHDENDFDQVSVKFEGVENDDFCVWSVTVQDEDLELIMKLMDDHDRYLEQDKELCKP